MNIAPDTWATYEDLTFKDILEQSTLLGYYQKLTGSDIIAFNVFNFMKMTNDERKKVALHEMGHALGFGHHDSGIMRQGRFSMTELDEHIKEDYYELY
ncbi:zinc metalloprotease [Chengkuizengella marina]|uniref:Peptidase M10 metallopeptidase domain-containing protein n=1 Tax=Chengkuizengella marina TaxID=2507566 RepID=A0A6N9Q134_9BACL|nr:hypothetical protein [Chengkuizengella marina]NBI28483.1 hypothetical protein [Chengkuizengella marina]